MSAPEDKLNTLLSEKAHAERAIGDYLGLQFKIFALFSGAGGAVLALFFSKDSVPATFDLGYAAIIAAIAGCLVVLQSIATYGIALAYIHYKQVAIMPPLRELAGLPQDSLNAVAEFSRGPASKPVSFATGILAVAHFTVTSCLLVYAGLHQCNSKTKALAIVGTLLLLIFTCWAEVVLLNAMKKVGKSQMSGA